MDNFGNNQYGQTYNQPNNFNNVNNTNTGMNAPDYMLWLILGIIQIVTLCCCNCVAPIFGIITVIMVVGANNKYKTGDAFGYQKSMKTAKIINIVGWVLMFAGTIISFVTGMFSSIMDYASNLM